MDRYYSQNCKVMTFRKITNYTNFDKRNKLLFTPLVLGETDFGKILPRYLTWELGHE